MITCKLGKLGEEIDLPVKSRTISAMQRDVKKIELESVNGTPTTQYIATKRKLFINYDIVSEADKNILIGLEDLQHTDKTRLNYIYNTEDDTLINMTVRLSISSSGDRILRDKYFEGSVLLELKEC